MTRRNKINQLYLTQKETIMYQLICTSYDQIPIGHGQSSYLRLRNNWIEAVLDDKHMLEIIEKWQLSNDFTYPSKGSISDILEGKMDIPGVVIHVRIIKF